MNKRKFTKVAGLLFHQVAETARNGTWMDLALSIENFIKDTTKGRVFSRKGRLHRAYSNSLLSTVVLESVVDVVDKIYGLVNQCDAEVDTSDWTETSKSLLMEAVFSKNHHAALTLLMCGANPNKTCGLWGENIYVFAAENNMKDVFETMTLCNANLYQTDTIGHNALVVAVRNGHLEIAKFILQRGMSPDWYTFEDHMTLLHWAVENRRETSTPMIQFLLDEGANPNIRSHRPAAWALDVPGSGFTPLEFLTAREKGVSRYRDFNEEDMVVVNANAKLLTDKMNEAVADMDLALCMVSNQRLSSNSDCLLSSVAIEPSILQLIMNEVKCFDIKYPGNAMSPTTEYTGVVDGY